MYVIRHIPTNTFFKNVYSVPGEFRVKLVSLQEAMVFEKQEKAVNTRDRWCTGLTDSGNWEVREITLVLI